jgi:hypothetical protein
MNKIVMVVIIALFANCIGIYAVDTCDMNIIYNREIIVFSEDDNDYSIFIKSIIDSIGKLEIQFQMKLKKKPTFYIYTDHDSSSWKIFESKKSVIQTAMAGPINCIVYLTSPYDNFKNKEYYYSVPVHELVHLFYSPSDLWLREGLAVYLSEQLTEKQSVESIKTYKDLYPDKIARNSFLSYYNNCGWAVKYLIEEKFNNSIDQFRAFCKSKNRNQMIGYDNMDQFITEWKKWMKNS